MGKNQRGLTPGLWEGNRVSKQYLMFFPSNLRFLPLFRHGGGGDVQLELTGGQASLNTGTTAIGTKEVLGWFWWGPVN